MYFSWGVLVMDVGCEGVRRQGRNTLDTGRKILAKGRRIIVSPPVMPYFPPAPSVDWVGRRVQANAL